ncbi:MAG: NAD(P)H-hydrate dehydratase [Erythrobacter sp.]
MNDAQILTAEQMHAAEQRLFDGGVSVSDLMEIAAGRAAEWARRIAAGRSVTVLCGPGNNGGDGYVIARILKAAGLEVQIIAPLEPKTEAAQLARKAWGRPVLTSGGDADAEIFVDCLFGSGLARPLSGEHALLLRDLAQRHNLSIAIDVPSGIASDSGKILNERLPKCDVTLALGAWKFAHCSALARSWMGVQRLVPIGIDSVEGAAQLVERPQINAPADDAHKYSRGLCAVIGGAMPGASLLSAQSAMRAGAGYVKLLGSGAGYKAPAGLVRDDGPLEQTLADDRIRSIVVGPGLGRDETASETLAKVLSVGKATVIDADALHLLTPDRVAADGPVIATPHDGELEALCRAFGVVAEGRMGKARALAKVSAMVVVAKGPDTYIASPDGRLSIATPASSWLSVAGTGDVLAGIIASRMATGGEPFDAACQGVWLHGEAARICGAAFTADDLAASVSDALKTCL